MTGSPPKTAPEASAAAQPQEAEKQRGDAPEASTTQQSPQQSPQQESSPPSQTLVGEAIPVADEVRALTLRSNRAVALSLSAARHRGRVSRRVGGGLSRNVTERRTMHGRWLT